MMKVFREVKMKVSQFEVGDKIKVDIAGLGKFTATVQQITDRGTLFFMDDCVIRKPMNAENTNEGGFDSSDLCKWMNNILIDFFPEKLKKKMVKFENGALLSIPTYGQVFGCDTQDEWDKANIEIDNVKQLPLMKNRKNRVCDCDGDWCWHWLQNPLKQESSSAFFCLVTYLGDANDGSASYSGGVRPAFLIA